MNEKFLKKAIGKSIAKQMADKYKGLKRMVKDDSSNDKDDTRSIWISKIDFEQFFTGDNTTANGVRIYLGVAGKYKGKDGDEDYECRQGYHNQTNLILVPTTSDGEDPTFSNSRNMTKESDKAALITFGSRIDDDYDLCPPSYGPNGTCEEII